MTDKQSMWEQRIADRAAELRDLFPGLSEEDAKAFAATDIGRAS